MVIISRHGSDDLGMKITFEKGRQVSFMDTAREIGTTIIVSCLFDEIPVRKTEMKKNIRAQYARAEQIIEAYSLITSNVKFSYLNSSNSLGTQKSKTSWSSSGLESLDRNIEYLVGKKMFDSLLLLKSSPEFLIPKQIEGTTIKGDYLYKNLIKSIFIHLFILKNSLNSSNIEIT